MNKEIKSGRIALWAAIFGALIGGTLSFLGSYITTQSQGEREARETKRESYVRLLTEGEEYRLSLINMKSSALAQDQDKYAQAYADDWNHAAALYAASGELRMLASPEEQAAIEKVTDEFFGVNHELHYQNVDYASLDQGISGGGAALRDLIEQGKMQFGE